MLDALCEHLLEKPGLYPSEMIVFLWGEFEVLVTASTYKTGAANVAIALSCTNQQHNVDYDLISTAARNTGFPSRVLSKIPRPLASQRQLA
jgi:hypothetical protein